MYLKYKLLTSEINEYISNITKQIPLIKEIWLIGSRANATERAESDWDFLVFGNTNLMTELKKNKNYFRSNIDLLIVNQKLDIFSSPWDENKGNKFSTFEWEKITNDTAVYIAHKTDFFKTKSSNGDREINVGTYKKYKLNAYLIWP